MNRFTYLRCRVQLWLWIASNDRVLWIMYGIIAFALLSLILIIILTTRSTY